MAVCRPEFEKPFVAVLVSEEDETYANIMHCLTYNPMHKTPEGELNKVTDFIA